MQSWAPRVLRPVDCKVQTEFVGESGKNRVVIAGRQKDLLVSRLHLPHRLTLPLRGCREKCEGRVSGQVDRLVDVAVIPTAVVIDRSKVKELPRRYRSTVVIFIVFVDVIYNQPRPTRPTLSWSSVWLIKPAMMQYDPGCQEAVSSGMHDGCLAPPILCIHHSKKRQNLKHVPKWKCFALEACVHFTANLTVCLTVFERESF